MRASGLLLLLALGGCAQLSQMTSPVASKGPGESACEAECNLPTSPDSLGNIACVQDRACVTCTPPVSAPSGSKCGCWLWSREPMSSDPTDAGLGPDWKREGKNPGDKVLKDPERRYLCQCGY
jgi:hypothetical protein